MSKIKSSKNKKVPEVKEKQKISSFFKKIDVKNEDDDFKPKTLTTKPIDNKLTDQVGSRKEDQVENSKKGSVSNKNKEKVTKEPSVEKVKAAPPKKLTLLDDSDDDFVSTALNKKKQAAPPKVIPEEPKNGPKLKKNLTRDSKRANGQNNTKTEKNAALDEEELLRELLELRNEEKSDENDIKADRKKDLVEEKSQRLKFFGVEINDESKLVVNLDSVGPGTQERSLEKPIITPEKSYLNRDEILADITNSKGLDSLLSDVKLLPSARLKSPPHSTPVTNKRKSSEDTDIIPATPEDEPKPKPKPKSKISLNSKFFKNGERENEIPEFKVRSPPKKIRKIITEPKIVVNLAEITEKQFQELHESSFSKPAAEILSIDDISVLSSLEPSKPNKINQKVSNSKKKHPQTDWDSPSLLNRLPTQKSPERTPTEKISICTSPTLSPRLKMASSPPNLSQPLQKTPTPIQNSATKLENSLNFEKKLNFNMAAMKNDSSSKWSTKLKSPIKTVPKVLHTTTSPSKDTNSLLDYFKNLPSSCEEKKNVVIESDFIVTKPQPVLEDFYFEDDSWDIDIPELNLEKWQYCVVSEVQSDLYQNFTIKVVSENRQGVVTLQGIWRNLILKKGDRVNVVATKTNNGYVVNNESGFVVYEPDYLISGTSIVGSLFCKRRGVLSDKFRGTDSDSQMMIIGCIVHRLLQETLKLELKSLADIERALMDILSGQDMLKSLYGSDCSIDVIKSQTLPFVAKIHDFVTTYVYLKKSRDRQNWDGVIENIADIEENIWCYNYGIKGKVDVTLKTIKAKKQYNAFDSSKNQITLPLELKTGRASFSLEHRGQIILYTMIMTDLGHKVDSGLLLYLREGVMKEIEAKHQEKRDLIMLRNELTYYLKKQPTVEASTSKNSEASSKNSESKMSMKSTVAVGDLQFSELPEPINHPNACKKCPYAQICTTFLSKDKTFSSEANTHPLKALSSELLAHLTQAHIDYFIQWASLIHIESSYKPPIKELKDIWRKPPLEREALGKSLSYLEMCRDVLEKTEPFMHYFRRIAKSEKCKDPKLGSFVSSGLVGNKDPKLGSFVSSGLVVGNYVIVSSDNRVAIASGFISKISKDEIVVGLERNLFERYKNKTFHIDTYESQTIFNYSLTNIAALLEDNEKAQQLRSLIIDKKVPEFASKLSKTVVVVGEKTLKRLNKNQQRAVLKVLATNDYLLIKGMPGTGKTATIVALIQLLVGLKKSVLITSHTNSAVDNVCLRLLDCGVDMLRLGSESRIHPMLKHCTERIKTMNCKSVDDLEQIYNKAQVIATTCLGANHPLLSKRKLDVCLVDESTQVLQCSVIKALQSCKTFVLIGDPEQLPPIVSNPEALLRGMNESLFERLHNNDNMITLTLQYRMNKTITQLANALTYNGQLLCADDSIGYAVLRLKSERLQTLYYNEPWLLATLDTHIDNSVVAIDTGATWKKRKGNDVLEDLKVPVQNVQEDEEQKYDNVSEVAIVCAIVEALKECGVQSDAIGIIAPYRSQVMYLKKIISSLDEKYPSKEQIEVNTVDQYQGRDKEIIIYSCTKSKDTSKIKSKANFEILEDKRRLTVAITRAKHKLIIIGDFCTLKTYSPFEILLNSLEPHQVLPLAYESKGFNWDKVMEKLKIYDL